ncbi:TPA: DUF551 domain-containing protein [Salmonella enterica]
MTITKERLLKIQHWRETYGADSNVMLPAEEAEDLARIALASLEAEKGADPVVFTDERNLHHIARGRETSLIWGKQNQEVGDIPLYRHAQPVPVVPEDISGIIERFQYQADHLSEWHHIDEHSCKVNRRDLVTALEFMNSCRAAMLQGAEPVSQTYELPELIEGMEVSVDVSTCDFDAGHRYFGTVTEVSELYTAKNGYILLVQDAKPNFDVNGNSPVSPGSWISCSERMPDNDESKPIAIFTGKCLGQGMFVATYDDDGFFDYWEGMEIIGVSHWMPLPEPPQEVNRG